MTWPYDQGWEDTRIYGYSLNDPAQSFSHLSPDLIWGAPAGFETPMPNDLPVTSPYLSPRTRVNHLAVRGGSPGATSASVPHQQNATSARIPADLNLSQEPAVISRGRNNTRSSARRRQISG
jgi:hypothetical protein